MAVVAVLALARSPRRSRPSCPRLPLPSLEAVPASRAEGQGRFAYLLLIILLAIGLGFVARRLRVTHYKVRISLILETMHRTYGIVRI